jgi:hypothetical protein
VRADINKKEYVIIKAKLKLSSQAADYKSLSMPSYGRVITTLQSGGRGQTQMA